MTKVLTSGLVLLVIYVGFGLLLYLNQRSFLYFPTPDFDHGFDSFVVNNDGESINVVVLNQGREKAILYFGGNGESVVADAPDFKLLFPFHTVYLVNYRGYGGSSGRPEESGIYSDALTIFDQIKQQHNAVSVIGRSLGTGVATLIASTRMIDRLALITPFDSVQHIAQDRFFFYPMSLLLKDRYDSLSRVKQITVPTLILVAEYDEVIGRKYTMNLVAAFDPGQVTVTIVKDTGHNTILAEEGASGLLGAYFSSQ